VTIGRNLTVTGGAVTFPATAIASAGASTLDDYQEFSWVPYFAGSGGNSGTTYAVQAGVGVKIGRFVTLWGVMQVSAPGSIAGNLQLWGFPYFSGNAINAMGTVTISAFTPTSGTPFTFLSGYIGVNEAVANLTYLPAGGGTAIIGLPASVVMAGTTIYFEARYFAIA
jgi:hypothetical protein